MKAYLRYLAFYLTLLTPVFFFTDCNEGTSAEQHTSKPAYKHVIVIGIDGMSPDGIRNASTPNMDMMMQNGAFTLHARSVLPTSSSSNWASMIMGAGPEQHGITSNGWERDDHILPPVVSGDEGIFPTIFSAIRKQQPNAEIGAIYHWSGFGRLVEKTALNYDHHVDSEDSTTLAAIDYIKDKQPNFLFIHLDHVDGAGHGAGHGTPEYYAAVSKADSLIGEIVKATENTAMGGQVLFLVTSDHGGIGTGHGGETVEEIEIPFILYGAGIKKGLEMPQTVYTYDNAATVAFALGIKQPYAWIGRPVKAAFTGYPVPDMTGQKPMLLSPAIVPGRQGLRPAGGLFTDTMEVSITNREKSGTLYYTLDGSEPTASSFKYEGPFKLATTTVVRSVVITDDGNTSPMGEAYMRFYDPTKGNGLNYRVYEDPDNSWMMLPNFGSYNAVRTGTVAEIDHTLIDMGREAFTGAVIDGYIQIDEPGKYRFYLMSDDGSRLYINGQEVVNNDGDHGAIERSGTVTLEPGYHTIKVEWFNGGGGYWLHAMYKGPGVGKQIIPAEKLFTKKPL